MTRTFAEYEAIAAEIAEKLRPHAKAYYEPFGNYISIERVSDGQNALVGPGSNVSDVHQWCGHFEPDGVPISTNLPDDADGGDVLLGIVAAVGPWARARVERRTVPKMAREAVDALLDAVVKVRTMHEVATLSENHEAMALAAWAMRELRVTSEALIRKSGIERAEACQRHLNSIVGEVLR